MGKSAGKSATIEFSIQIESNQQIDNDKSTRVEYLVEQLRNSADFLVFYGEFINGIVVPTEILMPFSHQIKMHNDFCLSIVRIS